MPFSDKIRRDWAPILFFGCVVAAKTYSLIVCLLVVAVALQVVRAKIEERKFLFALPEYHAYRGAAGFLWPRMGRGR